MLTQEEIKEKLLQLKPTRFSVQNTQDNSYFFTLIFEDKRIFVEYFYEDNEEHVVSIVFNPEAIGYSGTFKEVYNNLLKLKN